MCSNHPYMQPLGWIGKGAAQTGRLNTYEGHLRLSSNGHAWLQRTVSKRQMCGTESRFLKREEKLSTPRKRLKSGWDRHKLNPREISEDGGINVEYNASLTSPCIENRVTRMFANPDINPAQQDLTSVIN